MRESESETERERERERVRQREDSEGDIAGGEESGKGAYKKWMKKEAPQTHKRVRLQT